MKTSRIICAMTALGLGVSLASAGPAVTGAYAAADVGVTSAAQTAWPTQFPLPTGFAPEGITIGTKPYAYFGSVANGSIFRVDLRTGAGETISTAPGPDYMSIGLKIDNRDRIFVAGGDAADQGRVIDARTGKVLRSYVFSDDGSQSFANDVVIADNAAWFTDSFKGVLYKLPFGPHGELPAKAQTITMHGGGFDKATLINGISATPDGDGLLVSATEGGHIYRVDPRTGTTQEVTKAGFDGKTISTADGLLLQGNTLYVADRVANKFWVFHLDESGTKATYATTLTNPAFQGSSSIAAYGNRLYMPNAKSGRGGTPATTYDAVSVLRPLPSCD